MMPPGGTPDEVYGRCAALATLPARELLRQISERVFVVALNMGVSPTEVCDALAKSTADSVPDEETWREMCDDFAGHQEADGG